MMVAVTTRTGKGAPLTTAEMDANWNAIVADLNTKVTQAQARAAISVTGSLTYNSSTGVLGFTETPLTLSTIVAALGYTPLPNTGGTVSGSLNVTSTLQQGGNQVLHAGNYTAYSPTLTGGGASGTWGISISGNSAYASSAGNADTVDGYHSASFLRSVNGVGPDGSGNVTVNVDLSSRVAKSGDTMSGHLTLPSQTVQSTSPTINFYDTDQGSTRYLHVNSNLMGFLKTDGNWDMYMNNAGAMWTAGYGWLHDYFFRDVNHNQSYLGNCIGVNGAFTANCVLVDASLSDNGGVISMNRSYKTFYYNCNCNCK
jgi:hypothetical protein